MAVEPQMTQKEHLADEKIAELVQKGDADIFGILVTRYEAKLSRYINKFLFFGDEAKDLLQDIFIKTYVNIKSFDTTQRFSPWVYRIAHNELINAIKKRKSDKSINFFDFDLDVLLPHPIAKETADGEMEIKEMRELLDRGLKEINLKYKEPLVLHYFEDMSYAEIADILKIPISTVGVRIKRGKEALKKIVK